MTVLITGGAGFIGSYLATTLRQRGEKLVLLDNFSDYYNPAFKHARIALFANDPEITLIEGDVRDAALVDRIVRDHKVRRIAHMAAMPGVRASVDDVNQWVTVNVNGSVNLLEAARKHGVEQFILSSTSSVYGVTSHIPFVETDHADRPLAPYPATKRAAEIIAHSYHHLFGLNITCLRFFNVYGPQGRPDMMPIRVMKAIYDEQPITLFNAGNIHRDWTYIDDIVEGVVLALDRPLGYEIFNLGCGAPISLTAFVDYFEKLSGKTVERINAPTPPTEPPITYCDNSKARQLLGFDPRVEVHDGLKRTWQWYAERGHTEGW